MMRRSRPVTDVNLRYLKVLACLLLVLELAACGCGSSTSGSNSVPPNPSPSIASLSPTSATVGAASLALTVSGSSFISGSVVQWNGSSRATTYVSSTQLTATITASDLAAVGTAGVTVVNPPPGGGTSTQFNFLVNPAAPTVSISASPSSIALGSNTLLTWSSTSATSCNASGAWSSTEPTSGTQSVTPATAGAAIYTLSCTGPGGNGSASATVSVVAAIAYTVTVNPSSPGKAVTSQLLGMNMGAWGDPTSAAVLPALQAAGIKALRWPGGSFSDDYHWANNTVCGGYTDGNANFAKFVKDLAIPGSFDVALTANYGSNASCNGPGDPSEAAAWAAAALTDGITVSYMTVGNEEYGSWETDKHPLKNDAATYAAAMTGSSGYYASIKAASPKTLVGVDVNPGDFATWDPIVLANAKGSYDFVEFHFYAQAPGKEQDTYLVQQAAQELTTQIKLIQKALTGLGEPDMPIYVGELGSVYTNPGKQSLSITQGLFAGQALGELMNDGVARQTWWIGFYNCNGTLGNFDSSLYGWQNFGGYNIFADGPTDTACAGAGPVGTMSPTARAFQLFSNVAVTGESVLPATVTGPATDLRAYAATHSGGTALALFNVNPTTPMSATVTLSGLSSAKTVTVITYSKAIYDQSQKNVWAAPTTTSLGAQSLPLTLTLDPWSMNVVILQ